ncbi:hypothetical protein EBZ37_01965 [bacterium]|nr:hypothetical protein [bacterium]
MEKACRILHSFLWLTSFSLSLGVEVVRAQTQSSTSLSLNCGTGVNRSCEQAGRRVATLVEERIRQQVLPANSSGGLYRLKDLLTLPLSGSSPSSGEVNLATKSADFPKIEICSLNGNRFNGSKAEKDTNHLGKSCGQPDTIDSRTSTKGELRVQLLTGTGTRELSHLYGVYLEALDCVSREILEELRTDSEVELLGDDKINSCQSLLADYNEGKAKLQASFEQLSGESRALCKFTRDGLPEQAGCYAQAGIEALDSLFSALVVCESFRRSNEAFAAFKKEFFSPASRQSWWLELSEECEKKIPSSKSNYLSAFSSCYHDKFRDLIAAESKSWFPTSGSCRLK